MPRLPPLNALRAFEAAAQPGSIKDAAKELSVTPGAVSQQIALIEDRIGTRLFRRLNRALELTDLLAWQRRAEERRGFGVAATAARWRTEGLGAVVRGPRHPTDPKGGAIRTEL